MHKSHFIIIHLFVLLISFNSIKSGVMLGFYLADTQSFVELFCVNQDKPEMECNGKCELSKLAQQNPSNEKPNYLDFLQKEVVVYFSAPLKYNFKHKSFQTLISEVYQNNYQFLFAQEISHPPAV